LAGDAPHPPAPASAGGFRRALSYAGLGAAGLDPDGAEDWDAASAAIAQLAAPPSPPHRPPHGGPPPPHGAPQMGMDCEKAVMELSQLPDKSPQMLALCSMGRNMGDDGSYFQCTQTTYSVDDEEKSFNYWKVYFGQMCIDCDGPHGGGGGRRLQRHHHGGEGGYEQDIGMCLPAACTEMDARVAGIQFAKMIQPYVNISFGPPMHPHNHTDYHWVAGAQQTCENSLDVGGWIVLLILIVFGIFAIAATLEYPYGLRPSSSKPKPVVKPEPEPEPAPTGTIQAGGSVDTVPRQLLQSGGTALLSPPTAPATESMAVQVMRCWDCQRNWASLIRPVKEPEQGHAGLKTLNGIRVIAIASIALGHSFAFMPADNDMYAYQVVLKRFSAQTLIGNMRNSTGLAFNSVDTFFFLSGFLATWASESRKGPLLPAQISTNAARVVPLAVLEKYIKPGGRQVSWLKFVQGTTLHRYLRLTPLYCVVLLIYICEAPPVV